MEGLINEKVNLYYAKLNECKKLDRQWRRPFYISLALKFLYIVIFTCTIYFSNQYIKNHYENIIEIIVHTIFSVALGFLLCGIWALLLKLILYFFRKSMLKKQPILLLLQQDVMLLKCEVIESLKKPEGTTLAKPYDGCPYPAPLKEEWKEQERILCANTGLLWNYNVLKMKTRAWVWFLIALAIVVITIVTIIAIYIAIMIFVACLFFALLFGMFTSSDSRYDRKYDYEKTPKIKYKDSYTDNNKKEEPNERALAKAKICSSKKRIKEVKDLLKQWGIEVLDI